MHTMRAGKGAGKEPTGCRKAGDAARDWAEPFEEGTCTLGPKADHTVTRREQGRGLCGQAETPKRTAGELGVKWNPEGRRGREAGKGSDPCRSR